MTASSHPSGIEREGEQPSPTHSLRLCVMVAVCVSWYVSVNEGYDYSYGIGRATMNTSKGTSEWWEEKER